MFSEHLSKFFCSKALKAYGNGSAMVRQRFGSGTARYGMVRQRFGNGSATVRHGTALYVAGPCPLRNCAPLVLLKIFVFYILFWKNQDLIIIFVKKALEVVIRCMRAIIFDNLVWIYSISFAFSVFFSKSIRIMTNSVKPC